MGGLSLISKINTGARVTVVPANFAGVPANLQASEDTLSGLSGRALQAVGKFDRTVTWKSSKLEQVIYVAQQLKHTLLELPAIKGLIFVEFLCTAEHTE
ncbi:hypothetical protein HPB50_017482 [Hyalomma asiaticum]|uniref:Uncharacterized protein n=1 Tax=Hyalomma asiaticum TaxID=266040 RepID=A0ACB7S1L7_HYAAI|nr:hypothetical protein HPB50_017482 [Hyalomma asiaticum]